MWRNELKRDWPHVHVCSLRNVVSVRIYIISITHIFPHVTLQWNRNRWQKNPQWFFTFHMVWYQWQRFIDFVVRQRRDCYRLAWRHGHDHRGTYGYMYNNNNLHLNYLKPSLCQWTGVVVFSLSSIAVPAVRSMRGQKVRIQARCWQGTVVIYCVPSFRQALVWNLWCHCKAGHFRSQMTVFWSFCSLMLRTHLRC